jgi:hypothetical protein
MQDAPIASVFPAAPVPQSRSPFIEKLTNFPGKLASLSHPEPRPLSALTELTLPPVARSILEPPLKVMNFRIKTVEVRDPNPKAKARQYTVADGDDCTIAFLHLDSDILADGAYWERVSSIGFLLKGKPEQGPTTLRILSVGAQRVASAYKSVWAQWKYLGLDTAYIEWYDIEELKAIPDEQDRAGQLRVILELNGQDPASPTPPGTVVIHVAGNIGELDMSKDKINVSDVVGPVNIKSKLERVTQTVKNAQTLPKDKRQQLAQLIDDLQAALKATAERKPEESEAVAQAAEAVANEAVKEKPNKGFLNITVEGLKSAAKAVEDIAPTVIGVAAKIASFVLGL